MAIAPEPADYGDRRILEAMAVSMFKSVQAACNRGDLIELKQLLTDDVRRAVGWLRVDANGVTSPDEVVGEPRARCAGRLGGDPREGVAFVIEARLRECE